MSPWVQFTSTSLALLIEFGARSKAFEDYRPWAQIPQRVDHGRRGTGTYFIGDRPNSVATFFLNVLGRPKQIEYLDELIARLTSYLLETRTYLESKSETDDLYDYLGSLGAMKVTAARLDWLGTVRKHIK